MLLVATLATWSAWPVRADLRPEGLEGAPTQGPVALDSWTREDGLAVIYVPRHDGLVTIDVLVRSGAADDPPDRRGLAHMSGKLLLHGTAELDRFALDDSLSDLGARLQVEVDEAGTRLRGEVLARNAPALLGLMARLLASEGPAADAFGRARRELQADLDYDHENDRLIATRYFLRFAYEGHPYGTWVEGTHRSLENITPEDVAHFRADHYRPSNLIVAVSGDLGRETLEEGLRSALPLDPEPPPIKVERALPKRSGRRFLLVDKPDRTQNQILVGHRVPPPTASEWPALEVGSAILGGNFSSRLTRDLRATRGWTYTIASDLWRAPASGTLVVWTFTAPDRALDSVRAILEHLDRLAEGGATREEVESARDYVSANLTLTRDTPAIVAREAARMVHYGGQAVDAMLLAERVRAVDKAALDAVLARWFAAADTDLVMVCTAEHFARAVLSIPGVGSVEIASYDEQ